MLLPDTAGLNNKPVYFDQEEYDKIYVSAFTATYFYDNEDFIANKIGLRH